jgi:hypothetical protein
MKRDFITSLTHRKFVSNKNQDGSVRSTDVEKRLQECKKCGTPDESSCKSADEVRNEIEGRADRIFQLEIVTGTALVVKYFPIPQCTVPRSSLFIVVYPWSHS